MGMGKTGRVLVLFIAWASVASATTDHCKKLLEMQPGQGYLLGVVAGGRATGLHLSPAAQELGFKTIHIIPSGMPDDIVSGFKDSHYDFGSITFDGNANLLEVADKVRWIAASKGLKVAGFTVGLDYGVQGKEILSDLLDTPGNDPWYSHLRTDKGALNHHMARNGLKVAHTESFSVEKALAQASSFKYPVFVKPSSGWASIGAAPAYNESELRTSLENLQLKAKQMKLLPGSVVIQQLLNRDTVYFVDTASALIDGKPRRIRTGVWIDQRKSSPFPNEVWDFIYMLPPPGAISESERPLLDILVARDDAVLTAASVRAGSTHIEAMSPLPRPSVPEDLLPTDPNHRLPGIRTPHLEWRATGTNPYWIDILSNTFPELLADFPTMYSQWHEHVALVFVRAHGAGKILQSAHDFMKTLETPGTKGGYAFEWSLKPVGTEFSGPTVDGPTMMGVAAIAGPSHEALLEVLERVRTEEPSMVK